MAAKQECKLCEAYGFTCKKGGILDFAPRLIVTSRGSEFRVDHPIEECEAYTEKVTPEQLASVLKKRMGTIHFSKPDNNLG